MAFPLALDGRSEVPSRGELWSMLLGALFASAILVAAFRVAAFASAPLADDELAYRDPRPVMRAAEPRGPRPVVVVGPERRIAVRHLRPTTPVVAVVETVVAAPEPAVVSAVAATPESVIVTAEPVIPTPP